MKIPQDRSMEIQQKSAIKKEVKENPNFDNSGNTKACKLE